MNTIKLRSLDTPLVNFDITHDPHGSIHWKGTDLYMDVHCDCGHTSEIKGDNIFFLKCPSCGTVYELNGFIQLIKRADISEQQHEVEIKHPVL